MITFDEEQEQEIQLRIQKAQQEIKEREQWVISADQFFREALAAVSSKVNQGLYDQYVLEVGKQYYTSFRRSNFSQPQEKQDAAPKQE